MDVHRTSDGRRPSKLFFHPRGWGYHVFLEARMIRIMCELQQPGQQLEKEGVENIVMFFGSARAKSRDDYDKAVAELQAKVDQRI